MSAQILELNVEVHQAVTTATVAAPISSESGGHHAAATWTSRHIRKRATQLLECSHPQTIYQRP